MGFYVPPRCRVTARHLYRTLAHRLYRATLPQPRQRWAVRRDDGKYWAGPYKWQGRTFSNNPALRYLYGTRAAAESAILWSGLDKVTVEQIQ